MIRQDWSTLKKLMFAKTAAAGAAVTEATATGNPLTFVTDLARPLKSLLIPFTPQQEGTGDPSPQNKRSILPWDGLNVGHAGKNLAKMTYGKVPSASTGAMVDYNGWSSDAIKIDRTRNYFVSGITSIAYSYAFYYGEDGSYLGYVIHREDYSPNNDSYFSSATYVKIRIDVSESTTFSIQFEVGSTASEYEAPHITETDIVFPSTVYGGTLDVVSGVLTVDTVCDTFTWGDGSGSADLANVTRKAFTLSHSVANTTTSTGKFCDKAKFLNDFSSNSVHFYTSVSGGVSAVQIFLPIGTPDTETVQVAYPLATPQEIQLTPAQITALIGNNTIWSDGNGSMTATYLKKG